MMATALLLFLMGIFVIANAGNLVGVFKGDKKITVFKTDTSSDSAIGQLKGSKAQDIGTKENWPGTSGG